MSQRGPIARCLLDALDESDSISSAGRSLRLVVRALLAVGESPTTLGSDLDSIRPMVSAELDGVLSDLMDQLAGWGAPSERLKVAEAAASEWVAESNGRTTIGLPLGTAAIEVSLARLVDNLDGERNTSVVLSRNTAANPRSELVRSAHDYIGCIWSEFGLVIEWSTAEARTIVGRSAEPKSRTYAVEDRLGSTVMAFSSELWAAPDVVELLCAYHANGALTEECVATLLLRSIPRPA